MVMRTTFVTRTLREMTEKGGQNFSCVFHNGFRFDMTFLNKGLWLSLWETQDVSLLVSGLTTLKSYTVGCHIKLNTPLNAINNPFSNLHRAPTSMKKEGFEAYFLITSLTLILTMANFFSELSPEDVEFVLEYLSSGKRCFLYEVVTGFNSLAATLDNNDFWSIKTFYSRLRDEGISQKEWEGSHKLYKVLRMRNLSDFNNIFNIQDVFILGVILEYRWQKMKEDAGFGPRCFTSTST